MATNIGTSKLGRFPSILAIGFVGWALCAAIKFVGMALAPNIQLVMIVQAIGAPIIFVLLTWLYSSMFGYTKLWQTAILFLLIVNFVDFFLVALVIIKSLEMFTSVPGTWIPFLLIFTSTYIVARLASRKAYGDIPSRSVRSIAEMLNAFSNHEKALYALSLI